MSQLSEVDFQRLQETLLELKTRNYSLEDQARKQRHALGEATARNKVLEQEFTKATKAIEKSKKISEVQKILHENENLQRKLVSQEEEFRLQNQTLLQELQLVISTNEGLENEMKLKNVPNSNIGGTDKQEQLLEEIYNLQFKLKTYEEVEDVNCNKIKQLEEELSSVRIKELESITSEFSMEDDSVKETSTTDKIGVVQQEVENLKIRLESNISEKNLSNQHNEELKAQIKILKDENEFQSSEIASLQEKLKKKQKTLTEVQLEKESLLEAQEHLKKEFENKISDIQNNLSDQNQRLQTQLNGCHLSLQESKTNSGEEIKSLQETIKSLEVKISQFPADLFQQLEAGNICLKNDVERLEIEKEKTEINFEKLKLDLERLSIEFSIVKAEKEESNRTREIITQELESISKVSEKRKVLLDEKVVELQQVVEVSREKEQQMEEERREKEEQHQDTINRLSTETSQVNRDLELKIQGLEEQVAELCEWPEKYSSVLGQLERVEEEKEQVEGELGRREEEWREEETMHKQEMDKLRQGVKVELEDVRRESEFRASDLETQLELTNVQKCEFEEQVGKLRQELRDGVEERKIHDKKGHSMVKDLKRQLQAEKRRNEKLSEKMKECFETDSMMSEEREVEADRSSISSWSLMSGERGSTQHLGGTLSSSTQHLPMSSSPLLQEENSQVQQENEELLARVARLQESKWQLEERLSMLEQSGASMAEELVTKSRLISNYCMEDRPKGAGFNRHTTVVNRSLPSTPTGDNKMRSLVDKLDRFVHAPGSHAGHPSKEVSNMQKMLEETLTKNMHLQQDLENMSQEVVRLSKMAVSPQ